MARWKDEPDRKPKSIMEKLPVVGLNGLYTVWIGIAFGIRMGWGCRHACEIICGEFFSCKFSTPVPFVSWHLRPRPLGFLRARKMHENGKENENELKSEREYEHLVHLIMVGGKLPFGGNGNGSFRSDFASHFLFPPSLTTSSFCRCRCCMRYAWVEPMWPFRLMYTGHVAC